MTTRFSNGDVDSVTASPTASPPTGITVERPPRKVTFFAVPGHACAPPPDRAIIAPSTRNGVLPYRLDSLIRTRSPPTPTRTTCRTD
ncbi:hypothetical protein [Streptomyces platensis]|uniref:hypothetical protein n=1 Tax=Streptomyces platensis TaxID=58346 RepID=UPI001F484811|nr:hypothetical protein [Streptomyces platensis]